MTPLPEITVSGSTVFASGRPLKTGIAARITTDGRYLVYQPTGGQGGFSSDVDAGCADLITEAQRAGMKKAPGCWILL
jgi:hypothetical protein